LVVALVRRTLVTASIGLMAGLVGAALLARLLGALLVDVDPLSPEIFLAMGVGTLVVAAAATILPALRALRLDPREALAER
jgi:ABC-type antimicrobial peptide transport system permease subunit